MDLKKKTGTGAAVKAAHSIWFTSEWSDQRAASTDNDSVGHNSGWFLTHFLHCVMIILICTGLKWKVLLMMTY